MIIKLIKSTFYHERETTRRLCRFLTKAKFLSMGVQCKAFEVAFAAWQKRKYCVLFNSGSSANLALIQALLNLGLLKKNDAVGFSAITWPTNVMPLVQLSLRPVPVDIQIATLNISLEELKKSYAKKKFACLFLTNLLGFSDDIVGIRDFCATHDIILIEDNCESLGSEYSGEKLGNFGLASTFSFFVGHHLSTIEGGAVCTDDDELAAMLIMVRSHGWDRHLPGTARTKLRKKHHISPFYGKYTFYDLAYNVRPTEIQGFLGLDQLHYIEEMIDKREKNYRILESVYKNKDFIPIVHGMSRNSNFAFPVICKNKRLQEKYVRKCDAAGIETRPIAGGMTTDQPFYMKYVGKSPPLPHAHFLNENGLYIGNNPEMTPAELRHIITTLSS